jgi:hypothetical protein
LHSLRASVATLGVSHEPAPAYCSSPVRFVVANLPHVRPLSDRDLLVFLNEISDNGVGAAKSFFAHWIDDLAVLTNKLRVDAREQRLGWPD